MIALRLLRILRIFSVIRNYRARAFCVGTLAATTAVAGPIDDRTAAHRALLAGQRPVYPISESGRWTESCVSIFFTIRPDGKTDELEPKRVRELIARTRGRQ
jgi:hypothetical protein